jgi:signal transduction histidine kinase
VIDSPHEAIDGHTIKLDLPDELRVTADRVRLAQVLENLVSNAFKYSPQGGEIEIQLSRETDRTLIRVSDEGIGLEPDDLSRLFKLFSRLDTAAGFEGTGLGL